MSRAVHLRAPEADELDAVCALHNRSEHHDGRQRVLELAELEEELNGDSVGSLAANVRIALLGNELAGYAYTFHLPSDVREERCYIFGKVDPQYRRHGVGSALMRWAIPRAETLLRSSASSLPKYIRTDAAERIDGPHALFASLGMRQVRWSEDLLRSLAELPPVPPAELAAGVRIVPWPSDRDEEIRVEKNVAFADHWGSTPTSAANWQISVRGFGSRPDLSFIAVDHDHRVVGHCLNRRYPADDALHGRRDGHIDSLGTLREWRGRGVASALIAHSLHAFAAHGLTHAAITVDADNPTGAARLYRALGFELESRDVVSELQVE